MISGSFTATYYPYPGILMIISDFTCNISTTRHGLTQHQLDLHTPIKTSASAFASSVWGRWRFISSPSKSALYGVQTHSLNLNVLWGFTLACKQKKGEKKSDAHAIKHANRWKNMPECFLVGFILSLIRYEWKFLIIGFNSVRKQTWIILHKCT